MGEVLMGQRKIKIRRFTCRRKDMKELMD